MKRVAVARAVSILGHPVVLVLAAGLIVASTRGASVAQLWWVGGALVAFGAIVMGFTAWQVRAGRWSHVDASERGERRSLNGFLAALLLLSAALLWFLTRRPYMSGALALSGVVIVMALLVARSIKVSLHAAFAAFSTALVWPVMLAVVAGILVTLAVAWSRLVLGRHVAADLIVGLLLGVAAGSAYHLWAA